jgi:hydrogenase-4 component F
MSEFLIVTSTFARQPWLGVAFVAGLLIALGALFWRLNQMSFGEPHGASIPARSSYTPLAAHMAMVLVTGIYLPGPLVASFQHIAGLLG